MINDCNRLLECLEPIHIKNTAAMMTLFNFFCIVNIEHRMGNITAEDIAEIPEKYIQYAIIMNAEQKKEKNLMNTQEIDWRFIKNTMN